MFDPAERDTIGRFTGLAAAYDCYRPDYPIAAIDCIVALSGVAPGRRLIDVGCGTGISSRPFAARGIEVIGIEPNAEMRQAATNHGGPSYRDGQADATGLTDATADVVLAAQAFHWFPHRAALQEFGRVLKPGGWVALLWNEPDREDVFTAGYELVIQKHSPDPELAALSQSQAGEHLRSCPLFEACHRVEFRHSQQMTIEQFLGRAFSVSFAPRQPLGRRSLETELRELHGHFAVAGIAALLYRTTLYSARKPLVAPGTG